MACPKCRAAKLVEIGMTLADARVTLHSCSRCETRWWDREGERIGLQHVLEMASSR